MKKKGKYFDDFRITDDEFNPNHRIAAKHADENAKLFAARLAEQAERRRNQREQEENE